KGKTVLVPLTEDGQHIRLFSKKWYGEYRDAEGVEQRVPLSANKTAAEQMLAELVKKAERVRAGVFTPAEDRMAGHQAVPIGEPFDAYREALLAAGVTAKRVQESRHHLDTLAADCSFARLCDFNRESLERWLAARVREGVSARTRNAYRESLVAFCNWCIDNERLDSNPFSRVKKANVKADPRRRRRAMDEGDLARLLDVARRRPLIEAQTGRRGRRKGELTARVKPEVREQLEWIGRERALIYKTLVLTGLRKGELASLAVGQLELGGPTPHIELDAADEKNREGNAVPIRADLADDLRAWLGERLAKLQDAARLRLPVSIPSCLPTDTPLFTVPTALVRILNHDLKAAGIPKRADGGRTLDVHALRHALGSLLSKGGVPLRTAQAAMRHSDPSLTANVYTDPRLLDVRGALDALPALPLGAGPDTDQEALQATGTDDRRPFPPEFPPTGGKPGQTESIPDNQIGGRLASIDPTQVDANLEISGETADFSTVDGAKCESGWPDSNRRSPAPKAGGLARLSYIPSRLVHRTSAQRESNPHVRHGKAVGCCYIMSTIAVPELSKSRGRRVGVEPTPIPYEGGALSAC